MSEVSLYQNFDVITCCKCGIAFAVPTHWNAKRRESKENFWCPNGHSQAYITSTADKLRAELATKDRALQQSLARESAQAASLKKTEAANKRLAKRLAAGVCPVPGCRRHFTNLQRHIQTEHAGHTLENGTGVKEIAAPVQ